MPLAADLVRVEVHIALRRGGQAGQCEGHGGQLRMLAQQPGEHALILGVVEGAGGVDQRAAGGEHGHGGFEDVELALRAARGRALAPFIDGLRLAAEHALAGAGRVHEDAVKERGEARGKLLRQRAGNGGVGHAHALHIAREDLRAGGNRLVAHEQPAPGHQRGDLRALAAGRGTQVEHALAGLRVKRRDGGKRAGLLQVEQPRLVQRREAGARVPAHEVRAPGPRHALAKPLLRQRAGGIAVRAEQQVQAQRALGRLLKRAFIRKKACFPEQAFHLGNIGGWKLVHGTVLYYFSLPRIRTAHRRRRSSTPDSTTTMRPISHAELKTLSVVVR